jgi:hypothetical protein
MSGGQLGNLMSKILNSVGKGITPQKVRTLSYKTRTILKERGKKPPTMSLSVGEPEAEEVHEANEYNETNEDNDEEEDLNN